MVTFGKWHYGNYLYTDIITCQLMIAQAFGEVTAVLKTDSLLGSDGQCLLSKLLLFVVIPVWSDHLRGKLMDWKHLYIDTPIYNKHTLDFVL